LPVTKKKRWEDWVEPEFTVPKLVPVFPINSFTPESECSHKRRVRSGSRFVCMVCHQSGFDWHPDLQIKEGDVLEPDETLDDHANKPKPTKVPRTPPIALTRKERRALQYPRLHRPEPISAGPSDSADDSEPSTAAGTDDN
jgi:hypothetical protein